MKNESPFCSSVRSEMFIAPRYYREYPKLLLGATCVSLLKELESIEIGLDL
jgi:hypothetical protein